MNCSKSSFRYNYSCAFLNDFSPCSIDDVKCSSSSEVVGSPNLIAIAHEPINLVTPMPVPNTKSSH